MDGVFTFYKEFGTPDKHTFGGAKELVKSGTDFTKTMHEYHVIESDKKGQPERVESVIRKIRKKWYQMMSKRRHPADCGIMAYGGCARPCNALYHG